MFLKYLAGPLIGAAIGYCTNLIAVKMLFYPKREIRVWGHKLPLTPGAIPKGKDRLAKAVGEVVGNTLITKEDIEEKLLSKEVEEKVAQVIDPYISTLLKNEIMDVTGVSEEGYLEKRDKVSAYLSNMIADSLAKLDLPTIMVEKGSSIIKEKLKNPMISMFLTDDLLASILQPMGEQMQRVIAEEGADYIKPIVDEKLEEIESDSVLELLSYFDIEEKAARETIVKIAMQFIKNGVDQIMNVLDIPKIVEDKMSKMDVDELEQLVMKVMKKELGMIVNLGALIGFILGILNIFF